MQPLFRAAPPLAFVFAFALPTGLALAQSAPIPSHPVTTPPAAGARPPTGGPATPPMTEPANTIQKGMVVPGANSFTEGQAKDRLRSHGYTGVSALTKGSDGIWRGTANKNGTSVHVEVDYKGDISTD